MRKRGPTIDVLLWDERPRLVRMPEREARDEIPAEAHYYPEKDDGGLDTGMLFLGALASTGAGAIAALFVVWWAAAAIAGAVVVVSFVWARRAPAAVVGGLYVLVPDGAGGWRPLPPYALRLREWRRVLDKHFRRTFPDAPPRPQGGERAMRTPAAMLDMEEMASERELMAAPRATGLAGLTPELIYAIITGLSLAAIVAMLALTSGAEAAV